MSQAILISDNEVINSLYEVNLRAYVATNVTIKDSLSAAKDLIEHSPNIDVVICFRELNKKDNAIESFLEYLNDNSLRIPIIVLGEPAEKIGSTIIIKNKYDIKGLLRSVAKILEITAKDMAEREVPKFFPIPLKLFSQMNKSSCDIYYRAEKDDFEFEYFKIIEKDADMDGSLEQYLRAGVDHLYVDAGERLRFINEASKAVVTELDRDDLSTEDRMEITQQGMGIVAEDIFENEVVSEEVANISRACIQSIETVVSAVPKMKNLLKMLMENPGDYCYKHSVLTTYISSEIINNIDWGTDEQKSKVAFALFFHDIYLVPIYKKYPDAISEEDLLFREDITDEDKEVVLNHAQKAGQLIKTFPKCPMGADMIITQHHGMINGKGFATNFKDDISPLSKIMIVAEDVAVSILSMYKEEEKVKVDKSRIIERLERKYKNYTYKKVIAAFEKARL